jgi:hypothetical protein
MTVSKSLTPSAPRTLSTFPSEAQVRLYPEVDLGMDR